MGTHHDGLFKLVFEDPRNAGALLACLLPKDTASKIDWSTLQWESGSGTDADLRQRHSDLVFSAEVARQRERVYFVLEHKSRSQAEAPMQLLGYVRQAITKFQDTQSKRLPQVVCVLVYHGPSRWRRGVNILAATNVTPGLWSNPADYLMSLPIVVDDLTSLGAAALRARELPVLPKLALFYLMRARRSGDFLAELRAWLDELRELAEDPNPTAAHDGLFEYILKVTDITHEELREFLAVEVGSHAEQLLKTYDRILEEGKAIGKVEGKAEGKAEGAAAVLRRLLEKRFGSLPAHILSRVLNSPPETIELWAERVLSVDTLEQVFAPES